MIRDAFAVRPLTVADEAEYVRFGRALDREDLRLRFGRYMQASDDSCIRRLRASPDSTPLAAFTPDGSIVGVGRLAEKPEPEFALIVHPAWKRRGVGWSLMAALLDLAEARGLAVVRGYVLAENRPMLELAREFGFRAVAAEGPTLTVERRLGVSAAA
jgi:ribosomal protein S18 acetylase RimI-like enzyme